MIGIVEPKWEKIAKALYLSHHTGSEQRSRSCSYQCNESILQISYYIEYRHPELTKFGLSWRYGVCTSVSGSC